jgi:hypothetical protein
MSRKQALQVGITVVLAILSLVACTGSAPAVATEAPAATSTPEQATATPQPPTATPTSEPATATPAPEPPPATGGEVGIDPLEVGDPEWGREIFEDDHQTRCSNCHSLDGSTFRVGPSLLGISKVAGERVPGLSPVEYLRQSILDPSAYIVEGYEDSRAMPPYELVVRAEGDIRSLGTLTQEELDALLAFLLTQ